MPLNLFYTMVQNSQKWPKTQIKGGGPALIYHGYQLYKADSENPTQKCLHMLIFPSCCLLLLAWYPLGLGLEQKEAVKPGMLTANRPLAPLRKVRTSSSARRRLAVFSVNVHFVFVVDQENHALSPLHQEPRLPWHAEKAES